MKKTVFPNLLMEKKRKTILFTKNLTPGKTFFEEKTKKINNREYREFSPKKSKLAAAIAKGLNQAGIYEGIKVLYLGCSHGYTPSFLSDMIGEEGFIFGVDFAPRVMRDFVFLCEKRKNLCPIMEDANNIKEISKRICEVDLLYQDVAQKNQLEIFVNNANAFLKKEGFGILAVKSRSIDVTKKPKLLFKELRKELEKQFTIVDYRELDPYEKDHCLFVIKKK